MLQSGIGTGHSDDGDLTPKAKHDMSLATFLGCDQAVGGDRGDGVVERIELGCGRDVAGSPITPFGPHNDLLLFSGGHGSLGRPNFQAGNLGVLRIRSWGAVLEPAFEN